jgi:serine/threonine protein kinase
LPNSPVGYIVACLTLDSLQRLCRKRELRITGRKIDLCARLRPSFLNNPEELLSQLYIYELKKICIKSAILPSVKKGDLINSIKEYCDHRFQLRQNRFKFIKFIGNGAFGTVSLYKDTWLNKNVAIKKVIVLDVDGISEILGEARIQAKMLHPNIITIHDLIDKKHPRIVMEYCNGGRLWDKIIAEKPPFQDEEQINKLMQEIANGLVKIHSLRITHRDLGPHNIFFDQHQTAKIGDFGIAHAKNYKTVSGCHPIFNAPEGPDRAKPSYDMYTLGQTILSCWNGINFNLDRHHLPDIPTCNHKLWSLVRDLLSESPGDRPSAQQLLDCSKKDI